jgi:hypothetical protein
MAVGLTVLNLSFLQQNGRFNYKLLQSKTRVKQGRITVLTNIRKNCGPTPFFLWKEFVIRAE